MLSQGHADSAASPDQSVPVQSTLLWSSFRSPEAVPLLASPASLQFLKWIFSNTFSLVFYLPDWFLLLLPKEPLTIKGLERLKWFTHSHKGNKGRSWGGGWPSASPAKC